MPSVIRNVKTYRSFFPTLRSGLLAGLAVAGLLASMAVASGQTPTTPPPTIPDSAQSTDNGKVKTTTSTTTDASGTPVQGVTSTMTFHRGRKKADPETGGKVVQSKDTKKSLKNEHKVETLAGVDSKLPDKQLFDKAIVAMNKGHYDVARLDLQTMLNTYPESQYQMRAKLAVADSWYKEGGSAALTQAESEYADFRVFFPNVPEAAEAQMRIGDIYFRQMDRPDRDYSKALHAEEEYRRMLTDYPDSTLVAQAKQRLREVQEVLATREADIASYYATRENWAAVIARYQTVADTYPLYSHMDDALIGLGDAYEAQARYVRGMKLPEAGKAKLEQIYDGQAADCYRKVVLEHSAAPHVEDARDRLAAMNLPIPEPTREQIADSVALENSRSSYRIADRAKLLFLRTPDTVVAAHIGDPSLTDPKAVVAPTIIKRVSEQFKDAFADPNAAAATTGAAATAPATEASAPAAAAPTPATAPAAAPLAFQEVPAAGSGEAPTSSVMSAAPPAASTTGSGMSVEILTPSARPAGAKANASDPNTILKPVGPPNQAALPDAEKPSEAPDRPNQVTGPTAPAQTPAAKGKTPKAPLDKADESSSKKKPKKGIKKINPF
jgi:outer membrane protein assembly factor BamD